MDKRRKVINEKKGRKKMVALKAIQPTIITNKEIIIDIVNEIRQKPNKKAINNNKIASELLKKLKR